MFKSLLSVTIGLCVFGIANPANAKTEAKPAIVLAAASLQESLDAAANRWSAKGHPKPRISFAGSSALARQIQAGAPADIFISADMAWMDSVQSQGLLRRGTRSNFLQNSLVLIAHKSNPVRVDIRQDRSLVSALGRGRLAVADPVNVPAGKYAKQALTHLNAWSSVRDRLAPADNVRSAMALVSRRAAPLGIVYETDARADPNVRIIAKFPANTHEQITYPLASIASSRNPEGNAFRQFLVSQEGKAIFRRFGFGVR